MRIHSHLRKSIITVCAIVTACLTVPSQAEAQHLWWELDGQKDATCLYGEITVLATHPESIYYCGANWHPGGAAGGYCGIQDNNSKERRTIFSIWDTSPKLHPKITAADVETEFGRFTNEGSGGHTHMVWPWKTGETFQFYIQKRRGKQHGTIDTSYYLFDLQQNKWRHSATINNPIGGKKEVATIGGGLNSFLENFGGKDVDRPKVALYRLWLGKVVASLRPLTRAGGDGIWGQLNDAYFLAEGSQQELRKVFRELESKYGKPVIIPKGRRARPLSIKRVPNDVLAALRKLPRAETVNYNSADPRDDGTYVIRVLSTNKRLGVEKSSDNGKDKVVQNAAQESHVLWKLEKTGDCFTIVNTNNNQVLTAPDGSRPDSKVELGPKGDSKGQEWAFVKEGDNYLIKSKQNEMILSVYGKMTSDGAPITQWPEPEKPISCQLWILSEVKDEGNSKK
jgi:hypothetical protein